MFVIFTIYPIIKLFLMSFLQWDYGSMLSQKFIGLENYKAVLGDETFRIAFENTIIYTLVTVPGQMILGLLAAVGVAFLRSSAPSPTHTFPCNNFKRNYDKTGADTRNASRLAPVFYCGIVVY